jgi:hypothetical protein
MEGSEIWDDDIWIEMAEDGDKGWKLRKLINLWGVLRVAKEHLASYGPLSSRWSVQGQVLTDPCHRDDLYRDKFLRTLVIEIVCTGTSSYGPLLSR